MDKINLPFFYRLGSQLSPLGKMNAQPQTRFDILMATYSVHSSVTTLLTWSGGLNVCHPAAKALLDAIQKAQDWASQKKPQDFSKDDLVADWTFQQVCDKAKSFETVLSEELLTISAYYATQKGIYSIPDLIDQAAKVFPPSVLEKLSQSVLQEVTYGGRCLAFDIPTASGFHMLRATEAVLHDYYLAVSKPKSKAKLDNWGAYIAALHKLTEQPTTKPD